jgi:hypothetical protein
MQRTAESKQEVGIRKSKTFRLLLLFLGVAVIERGEKIEALLNVLILSMHE